MRLVALLLALLLCGCRDERPFKDISNTAFEAGAMVGYAVKAFGGTTNDVELVIDAHRSNDIARANAVFDRLARTPEPSSMVFTNRLWPTNQVVLRYDFTDGIESLEELAFYLKWSGPLTNEWGTLRFVPKPLAGKTNNVIEIGNAGIILTGDNATDATSFKAVNMLACDKWRGHGAISCYGHGWGGIVTNITDSVEYWLNVQLWGNVDDGSTRHVQPRDVVIQSAQEPVVVETNGCWVIRFKEETTP